MRLRIHHGAAEIGGNCVELQSGQSRLLLDLGLPLKAGTHDLPDVPGLTDANPDLLGVVLSHPHLDHYGLLPLALRTIPVWLGEGACRLLEAAAPFTRSSTLPQTVSPYRGGQPFVVGPFGITPYLMDHSAYDSHALLVEAHGRRLFYSGDFRGHGRKAAVFERFLKHPPRDIDLLLMEGTTLGRDEAGISEKGVEDEAHAIMRATAGAVFACFSGQNIDRFVTFLRASMRAGRTFVVDAYMANLVSGLGLSSLPQMEDHPAIRVYLSKNQKRMILESKRFDLIDRYRGRRIYAEEIIARPAAFTMMFRSSMAGDPGAADPRGGSLIYSLWPGYLERDRIDLREWARERGVEFHIVHSSGHANREDLVRMVRAIAPGRLMPIHTEHPARYAQLFERVQCAQNGEWVAV
ncbi:MAG TPA: MBL fold metallo-hydrolase [Allosphingosinicella sp.]|nr:MBL fold metallo-hydrolase [Allosphingosinicella sp.]